MFITLALRRFEEFKGQPGLHTETLFLKMKQLWRFDLHFGPSLCPLPPQMLVQGEHPSAPPLGIKFWVKGHELYQVLAEKA